jgi:hypothetical protein
MEAEEVEAEAVQADGITAAAAHCHLPHQAVAKFPSNKITFFANIFGILYKQFEKSLERI